MKTKRLTQILTLAFAAIAFASVISCEGPAGPAGPAGADGKDGIDGTNGTDGTNGVDGDAVCMECHNTTTKAAITMAYDSSKHATSSELYPFGPMIYEYAGGRNDCAKCHSDQGFIETQYTGQDTTEFAFGLPQPIQCSTCHSFHNSLDFTNEPNTALRKYDAIDLLMYRAAGEPTVTIDLGVGGNLCGECHQPREVGPVDDGTGNYTFDSEHYGPHHGPQATSLAGLGAYELGTGYPTAGTGGTHVTDATCTTCHMNDAEHNFEPSLGACNTAECHNGNMTTVSDNTRQLSFATSMATLKDKLTTAGLLDANGSPVPGTYPVDQVGALYNYEWLAEDRSNGVHNFGYLETMLTNSLTVFP